MYQQEVPPAPQAGDQQALHDARAVHDMATMSVAGYSSSNGAPNWILGRINPSPQSGGATIPGAVLRDGQLVAPANAATVIMKIGAWTRIASSDPAAPEGGAYSWTEPMDVEKRHLTPEDRYSPFCFGGTVLFRFNAHSPGNPFGSPRLVFPDWAGDAPEGTRLLAQFAAALEKGEEKDLVRMLGHANSLLASAAFRRFLGAYGVDRVVVPQRYVQSRGHLLAVYTYLLITESPSSPTTGELLRAATRGSSPEMLRSIAAGAFSASVFAAGNGPANELAGSILSAIRERFGDAAIDADPYLQALFPR